LSLLPKEEANKVEMGIRQEEGRAADVFFLTGTAGRKIHDTVRLEQIRAGVLAAVANALTLLI
jgi:hypothetical protein